MEHPAPPPRICAWTVPQIEGKDRPLSRAYHAACVRDERYLVIFGGSTGVKLLNCTWEFDLSAERWSVIHHPGALVPSGRYGHTLTYLKKQKEILLLGGLDANRVACKDSTYVLDVNTWAWQSVRLGSERNSHREGKSAASSSTGCSWPKTRSAALVSERGLHTATLASTLSNRLILFGGLLNAAVGNGSLAHRHSNTTANQLIQVDTETFQVGEPKTTGTAPCPRYSHAAAVLDLGNHQVSLLVTGGMHLFTDFLCSDLFLLDLATWTWQTVPAMNAGSPNTARIPLAGGADAAPRAGGGNIPARKSSTIVGRDLWNEDKREREREREQFREGVDEASEGRLNLPAPGLAQHALCSLPKRPGATELAYVIGGRKGRRCSYSVFSLQPSLLRPLQHDVPHHLPPPPAAAPSAAGDLADQKVRKSALGSRLSMAALGGGVSYTAGEERARLAQQVTSMAGLLDGGGNGGIKYGWVSAEGILGKSRAHVQAQMRGDATPSRHDFLFSKPDRLSLALQLEGAAHPSLTRACRHSVGELPCPSFRHAWPRILVRSCACSRFASKMHVCICAGGRVSAWVS